MPAAGDYVIRVSGHGIIGRAKYSYLDFDFSENDGGFTAFGGVTDYQDGQWWYGSVDANANPSIWLRIVQIEKILTSGTYRLCGIGINYDSNYDCGTPSISVNARLGGVGVGGGSISPSGNNSNAFRTWSFSNRTDGVEADSIRIDLRSQTCSADNVAQVRRVRIWLAENSPTKGTSSEIAPQGLSANGSTDLAWWQEGDEGLVYGDAAYYSDDEWETATLYGGAGGLNIDGMNIPALQALDYNSSHVYEFPYTHGGGSMALSFTDGYDAEYSRNEPKYLKVEIIPT